MKPVPENWRKKLSDQIRQPYFHRLEAFVEAERERYTVFPPDQEIYSALEVTSFDDARVLLLGQDPYHDDHQAHGLCFSVRPGIKPPPSLVNIFKELNEDIGCPVPNHGCLLPWARQGILLLNAVLTVRAHQPNSHRGHGWELFTDAIIERLNERASPLVFILWGAYARRKKPLINQSRHRVIESAHPSPLSARHGFFGSHPFSKTNAALQEFGKPSIDWRLPDVGEERFPDPEQQA